MTSTHTQQFDEQALRDALAQADKPVLVDFYADWCPPCKVIAPTIDKTAESFAGRAIVAKLDTDAHPKLAKEFGVKSIPTTVIFLGGKEINRFIGVVSQADLTRALEAAGTQVAA